MSEERTEDMAQKYDTKPTLETVLERINAVAETLEAFRAETAERLDSLDSRIERIEIDLDKTRSVAHDTRADVRELRREMREHFPVVK
ncbi:MAG: hypothetical protein ACRD9R_19180 [Pyrinomonadaceae bacterium]